MIIFVPRQNKKGRGEFASATTALEETKKPWSASGLSMA
jgi:hypothetical protein